MKYIDIDKRAMELFKEGHEVKYFEMILCFAMQNLFVEKPEIEISQEEFDNILRDMVDYLADNYEISPWIVADAIITVISKTSVQEFLKDYEDQAKLLEGELDLR